MEGGSEKAALLSALLSEGHHGWVWREDGRF